MSDGVPIPLNWSRITDRLLLGSRPQTVADYAKLQAAGVSHCLNVCETADPTPIPAGLWHLDNPQPDDGAPKPAVWFRESIQFAFHCLDAAGYVLYAHCFDGYFRGAVTVYAILRAFGLSREQALAMIRLARPLALPEIALPPHMEKTLTYLASADEAVKAGW